MKFSNFKPIGNSGDYCEVTVTKRFLFFFKKKEKIILFKNPYGYWRYITNGDFLEYKHDSQIKRLSRAMEAQQKLEKLKNETTN